MVSGLLFCCLLAITAANPVRLDNDTAPYQIHGVQDIVNGFDSKYGDFNSILSLQRSGYPVCGATLISATRAITAAHCLNDHPQFQRHNYGKNDIAILKFDAIPLGTYVQPIAMVTDADGDLTDKLCWIAGWGRTSGTAQAGSRKLKFSDIKVMQNNDCSNYWDGITDTNICLEYFKYKVSACKGDSGGPLTCLLPDGEKFAGVTSWGHSGCPGTKPSVYTRVSKYQDWIAQNI
ncbi:chymotrypsinogen B-like [Liolophura sinensis]|uniref:chymotrypsinogen B-like n=1 Tax=Liolophura sinensis TaxID=3198878 RepID=UPI003159954A